VGFPLVWVAFRGSAVPPFIRGDPSHNAAGTSKRNKAFASMRGRSTDVAVQGDRRTAHPTHTFFPAAVKSGNGRGKNFPNFFPLWEGGVPRKNFPPS
jgi:hypothetical protein